MVVEEEEGLVVEQGMDMLVEDMDIQMAVLVNRTAMGRVMEKVKVKWEVVVKVMVVLMEMVIYHQMVVEKEGEEMVVKMEEIIHQKVMMLQMEVKHQMVQMVAVHMDL